MPRRLWCWAAYPKFARTRQMPENKLQQMFNDKFLEVVREVEGWVSDRIESDWSAYMKGLRSLGVQRGGWLRGLFRRDCIKIVDPITFEQFADRSEYVFMPPHQLLKHMSDFHRFVFVPKDLAEKILVLGLP